MGEHIGRAVKGLDDVMKLMRSKELRMTLKTIVDQKVTDLNCINLETIQVYQPRFNFDVLLYNNINFYICQYLYVDYRYY